MHHVLTLIGAVAKSPVTGQTVDLARHAVEIADAEAGEPDWLAENECCDVPFDGDPTAVRDHVAAEFQRSTIDVAVLPVHGRRKTLLIADMDSTLIEQECIDELADEVGYGEKVAAITEKAMRGEIEFEPALRERVALLAGLRTSIVDEVLADRITMTPGGRQLVQTMRSNNAHTMLISGGFTAFAAKIADRLGMDEFKANTLLVDEAGNFNGRAAEPLLGKNAKRQALVQKLRELGLEPDNAVAVGDGANDLAMIKLAGLGVAFRAKPAVRERADAVIDHGDLTALLYLQGYRRDEFVS